jgi:hypothetical protein
VWDAGDTVYACLLGRRPLELGIRTSDDSSGADVLDVRRLRLAGRYVAWEDQCNCPSNPTNTIFVKDLRTRRNLVATATLTSSRPGPTDDLELTSSGAVAWIASDIFTNATRREVHKGDAAGAAELDSGNRIGRRLTREGSTIRWTNAGIARTARLRSQ